MEKIKVLIVDDEPDISFFLSRNLQKNDYQTYIAATIADAEKLMYTLSPPVILLDNHLPDGYGIDYAEKIKLNFPGTKIIMVTAHDSPQDRVKAISNGVDHFVSKPFKIEDILAIVKKVAVEE